MTSRDTGELVLEEFEDPTSFFLGYELVMAQPSYSFVASEILDTFSNFHGSDPRDDGHESLLG